MVKIENYIRIVSEINVDELIPKINCFKYKNDGAYLFDDQIRVTAKLDSQFLVDDPAD